MKIILDNDGTVTDFNRFISKHAIVFFKEKYNMEIVNEDALEIQDILDMKNFFMKKYSCSEIEATKMMKEALNKFWVSLKFLDFTLLDRFRPGAAEFINEMRKKGNDIEIHSSRAKTCEKGIIGDIARKFTILQYHLNGVSMPTNKFHFYKNDEEKVKGIIEAKPDLVFDDKPEIIDILSSNGIRTICVNGNHNKNVVATKKVGKITDFTKENIDSTINGLFTKKEINYHERAAASDKFFQTIQKFGPLILNVFNPIILHKENMIVPNNEGIVYAPNHRSTLDPLVITAIINENVHWAALLRFFKGTDSIFNNSKNPILCKITKEVFTRLEYFPIDRITDNPKANNFDSIKDMNYFLKINQKIGIFGEGTTRREPGKDFGNFDDSFLLLSAKNDSWVQPITTLWIKELGLKEKVIVNFGQPFKVKGDISENMKHFLEIQKNNLLENMNLMEQLKEKQKTKTLK